MAVRRIVSNLKVDDTAAAKAFYGDILGLRLAMDFGWITTFVADAMAEPQVSLATEGGSGTPVPDLSVEVDDLDDIHRRMVAGGFAIEHGPVDEPWGVRRFFVRDPYGRLINILAHR